MIVTCPSCGTKFEIPDDKYRPGRKARCSNCSFVFALPEVGGAQSPAAEPAGLQASFDSPPTVGAENIPEAPPASFEDVIPPPPPDLPKSKKIFTGKKKKIILAVGALLVLILFASGAHLVYSALFSSPDADAPERTADERLAQTLGGAGSQDPAKEAARQAAVSRLALENVRQYSVRDNDKTGPIFVIEGSVLNNFDTPKDLVLLEVSVFDAKGNVLVLREQYCGVTLSSLQLRTLSKAALESALGNQVSILTNNTDIQPGMRVPFTSVFFDLPGSAYEFEVKIIDVQDPAPKK